MEANQILSDISIIEILITTISAFIGSFAHEYLSFLNSGTHVTLNRWVIIIISMVIDVFISLSLNPLVVVISPRLILLHPLLIGLLGTELITRLSTIGGSFSLLEYILGFFKITRAHGTETPKNGPREYKRHDDLPPIPAKYDRGDSRDHRALEKKGRYEDIIGESILIAESRILEAIIDYEKYHDSILFLKRYSEFSHLLLQIDRQLELATREDERLPAAIWSSYRDFNIAKDRAANIYKMIIG